MAKQQFSRKPLALLLEEAMGEYRLRRVLSALLKPHKKALPGV